MTPGGVGEAVMTGWVAGVLLVLLLRFLVQHVRVFGKGKGVKTK